jgi:hypothetical protein
MKTHPLILVAVLHSVVRVLAGGADAASSQDPAATPSTHALPVVSLDLNIGPGGVSPGVGERVALPALPVPGQGPNDKGAASTNAPGGGSSLTFQTAAVPSPAAALTIASGAIRIPNAHLSTTTPAFRVTVTSENSTAATGVVLIQIEHPLLNGDPNALVYLTPNGRRTDSTLLFPFSAATVAYSPPSQRWFIVQGNRGDEAPLSDFLGQQYTLLVIKP